MDLQNLFWKQLISLSVVQEFQIVIKMQLVDFNLNLEDSLILPCIVPVWNSICFSKSIFKVVGAILAHPGKPISHSIVPPSKPVKVSFVCKGEPISDRNVSLSKIVSTGSVSTGNTFVAVMLA